MEYMLMPLRRYADFSGRSRRKEYWMYALFYWLVISALFFLAIGTTAIGAMVGGFDGSIALSAIFFFSMLVWFLGNIIPYTAVTVRRFHDQNKSGWFALLVFIPSIGGIILFIFMCIEGTRGPNRFGHDPKASVSFVFE